MSVDARPRYLLFEKEGADPLWVPVNPAALPATVASARVALLEEHPDAEPGVYSIYGATSAVAQTVTVGGGEASLLGLTATSFYPAHPQHGVQLSISFEDFPFGEPAETTYSWQVDGVEVATTATYTPSAATHNGQTLSVVVTPEGYPQSTLVAGVIRRVPPAATAVTFDASFVLGEGPHDLDIATGFTGSGLTFSTSYGVVEGSIISFPDVETAATSVTITATNSGGTATKVLTLTVEDVAPVIVAPSSSDPDEWPIAEDETMPGRFLVTLAADYVTAEGEELGIYIGLVDPDTLTDAQLIDASGPGAPPGETLTTTSTWPGATEEEPVYAIYISFPIGSTTTISARSAVKELTTEPATEVERTTEPVLATAVAGDLAGDVYQTPGVFEVTNNSQTVTVVDGAPVVDDVEVEDDYELQAGESYAVKELVTTSDGEVHGPFFSTPITVLAGATAAPVLSDLVLTDATNTVSITADVPCRLHHRINAVAEDPDAATIIAGGGDSSGFIDITDTASGIELDIATGLDGTYQISFVAFVLPDGDPSNILSDTMDIDTVVPVLSGVSVDPDETTATLAWSTSEGSGTAYWLVDQNPTRTFAQVEAGGGADSGSQAVSLSGAQTAIEATGLTASTPYYFHLAHVDVDENESLVTSTSFTTDEAAAWAYSYDGTSLTVTSGEAAPEPFEYTLDGEDLTVTEVA